MKSSYLFKKGDKANSENYRGMMPSSTVSETFCKFLNVDIETMLKKDKTMSKGQAGLRPNRSCVDHMHILRKLIDGRKNARLTTCCFFLDRQKVFDKYGEMGCGKIRGKFRSGCFFLDVQKSYDTGWRNGLWKNMLKIGIGGKVWRLSTKNGRNV